MVDVLFVSGVCAKEVGEARAVRAAYLVLGRRVYRECLHVGISVPWTSVGLSELGKPATQGFLSTFLSTQDGSGLGQAEL
jgi:hypothetical protein